MSSKPARAAHPITLDQVRQVAFLARLSLAPGEEEVMAGEMSRILEYVDSLQELDTEGIEATFQVLLRRNVMRPDQVTASLAAAQVLANAPAQQESHFLMPRIIAG